jgi:L-ascorbate metabolism protein UlaG (beta-lactamase superfamily)
MIKLLPGCITTHKGPKSDHFDGEKFFNPQMDNQKSFSDFLKWQWTRERADWPDFVSDVAQNYEQPKELARNHFRVTFVNHATTLIEIDGVHILTDPVWSERVSPISFLGPKRVRMPGVPFEKLPKIDMVLISHNHYDHLDLPTLKRLDQAHSPLFIVPLGNKALLDSERIAKTEELDWGQSRDYKGIKITFEEALHWSGRAVVDSYSTLWGSFVVQSGASRIYFAGDTGYGTHFKRLQEKYQTFDVSLLPIGAYSPRWFMQSNHMNPEDAVKAFLDLKTKKAIGIHFGTFNLTDESIDDPINDLKKAMSERNVPSEMFVAPMNGNYFDFKQAD